MRMTPMEFQRSDQWKITQNTVLVPTYFSTDSDAKNLQSPKNSQQRALMKKQEYLFVLLFWPLKFILLWSFAKSGSELLNSGCV